MMKGFIKYLFIAIIFSALFCTGCTLDIDERQPFIKKYKYLEPDVENLFYLWLIQNVRLDKAIFLIQKFDNLEKYMLTENLMHSLEITKGILKYLEENQEQLKCSMTEYLPAYQDDIAEFKADIVPHLIEQDEQERPRLFFEYFYAQSYQLFLKANQRLQKMKQKQVSQDLSQQSNTAT